MEKNRYSKITENIWIGRLSILFTLLLLILIIFSLIFSYGLLLYILLCFFFGLAISRVLPREYRLHLILIALTIWASLFLPLFRVVLPPHPPQLIFEYKGEVTLSGNNFIINEVLDFYPAKKPKRIKISETLPSTIEEHIINLGGNWSAIQFNDFIRFERHREIEVKANSKKESLITRKAIIFLPKGNNYPIRLSDSEVTLYLPEKTFLESNQRVVSKQHFLDREIISLNLYSYDPDRVEFTFLEDNFRNELFREISFLSAFGWIDKFLLVGVGIIIGVLISIASDVLKAKIRSVFGEKIKEKIRKNLNVN